MSDVAKYLADNVLGIGCVGSFLLLAAFLLVWTFVIAPRRARRLLLELSDRGYVELDTAAPELQSALQVLAPILLEGTVRFEEGSRRTLNALVRTSGSRRRYVVNIAQSDEAGADGITTWQTIVIESAPLELDTEFSVRLTTHDRMARGREERFGLLRANVPGLSPEFAALYSVFSREGRSVTLSDGLQRAFLDVSRVLDASTHSNTRFGPSGWGISASNAWLDRRALHRLLAAADRISEAL